MLEIECIHCHRIVGRKDGRGLTGTSSTICGACVAAYYPELSRLLEH
jgi:hypothetical protein